MIAAASAARAAARSSPSARSTACTSAIAISSRRLRERADARGLPAVRRHLPAASARGRQPGRRADAAHAGRRAARRARPTAVRSTSSSCRSRRRSPLLGRGVRQPSCCIERYHMRELVIGYDHGFGRGRQGDAGVLAQLGERHGFDVDVVPATLDAAGAPISSSAIRDVDRARRSRARARVARPAVRVSRRRRARASARARHSAIRRSTSQLASPRKLLPPEGVYAVRAQTAARLFGGMMNLGARPTFGESTARSRCICSMSSGDWYGEAVSVELIRRLRDTTRFDRRRRARGAAWARRAGRPARVDPSVRAS